MPKLSRAARFAAAPRKSTGPVLLIVRGVMMGMIISFAAMLVLSLITLLTDSEALDSYMQYIMIGITMVSIFLGSVYATLRAQSMGLLIGMAVGALYVLISVGIGLKLDRETVSMLVVLNKLGAGIAAGALGGLVGVNLQ